MDGTAVSVSPNGQATVEEMQGFADRTADADTDAPASELLREKREREKRERDVE